MRGVFWFGFWQGREGCVGHADRNFSQVALLNKLLYVDVAFVSKFRLHLAAERACSSPDSPVGVVRCVSWTSGWLGLHLMLNWI